MRYLYTDVKEVEQLMSEKAAQREPFLFAFNFELTEALFVPNPLNQSEILFDTPLGNNRGEPQPITEIKIEPKAPTFEQYKEKFDVVQRHLHRGDSFLVNLAMRTPIEMQNTLRQIFDNTRAPYSLYIPERMVCFSPERFVHISADGTISTNPMKAPVLRIFASMRYTKFAKNFSKEKDVRVWTLLLFLPTTAKHAPSTPRSAPSTAIRSTRM